MKRYFFVLIYLSVLFLQKSYADSSYCAYPPFLTSTIKPNVVIMLDNSGSMKEPMYEQNGKNFNPDKKYYGIFDSDKTYKYDQNIPVDVFAYTGKPYDVNVDTSAKGAFVEKECDPETDDNCWSGNFLNWLVTRRIDATRMVLVGGKVEDRDGYDYDGDGEKEWKVLGNNEPSDPSFRKTYEYASLYSPFPDRTIFKIKSPANSGKKKNEYYPYEKLIASKKINGLFLKDKYGDTIGEFGTVSINHKWKTVHLKRNYSHPVVIAKPLSYKGTDPAIVRIRKVTSNSFKIRVQEWDYLDNNRTHTYENVSYLVVEKGEYTLEDGTKLLAENINLNEYINRYTNGCEEDETVENWQSVDFPPLSFSRKPVVIASIVSINEKDPVTLRIKNVSTSGFDIAMEEEEEKGGHEEERVSFIAIEPTVLKIDDNTYLEVGRAEKVTNEMKKIPLSKPNAGIFLADMQTTNGPDTAELRYKWDGADVKVKIEEERSCDRETRHTEETVGFISIGTDNVFNIAVVKEKEPKGILHDIYDKVRLGITFYRYDENSSNIYNKNKLDGGTLQFYIPKNPFIKDPSSDNGYRQLNGYIGTSLDDIVDAVEHYPLVWGTTPIAENLWEIIRYFEQKSPYYSSNDFELADSSSPEKDPFYYPEYSQKVKCAKSFVLIFTDGYPFKDANIPDFIVDYDEDGKTCSDCKVEQNCDCSSTDQDAYGHDNLDDVAYWAHWNKDKDDYRDLRDDLDGNQYLTIYTVGFAGGTIRPILKDTADNGGGKAYAAEDGFALREAILDAINDILKKTASSTTVSAFSSRGRKSSILAQTVFYPEKHFNGYKTNWIGYLYGYWFFSSVKVQNIREDSNNNKALDKDDGIIQFDVDSSGKLRINVYQPDSDGDKGSLIKTYSSLDEVQYVFEAGEKLKETSPSARKIYTVSTDNNLVPFKSITKTLFEDYLGNYLSFPSCLGSTSSEKVENLIKYIRGEDIEGCRSRTVNDAGDVWKLSDIIYSSPKIVNYPDKGYAVVFAGSNGGMLHAFRVGYISKDNLGENQIAKLCNSKTDCTTDLLGEELWAFIPKNVLPYLRYLPDPNYCHMYFVDASPYVFDYKGRKILIGGMRLGGGCGCNGSDCINPPSDTCPDKGSNECVGLSSYFALDITDPEEPKFLWEFSNKDLGFSFSGPGVVKKGDKDYVIFASGPTNYRGDSDQSLKLFIVDVDTGKLVRTVDRFPGNSIILALGSEIKNSFGGRLFTEGLDFDEDGITDYIALGYSKKVNSKWRGGIIFGNVKDYNPSKWNFSRYFDDIEPITAKVEFMKCFNNWYMYFGTGRWFYKTDESSINQPNKLYGIKLDCNGGECTPDQNFARNSSDICSGSSFYKSWSISLNTDDKGFYPERCITDPTTTKQNIIVFTTVEPTEDICGFGGRTRVWALNCATGGALSEQCASYPITRAKGKVLVQTSNGDVREKSLSKYLNNKTPEKASPFFSGIGPEGAPPISPYINQIIRSGEVMLWFEK